jgi:tRNA(fMet)-specific endonuclease VapC
MFVLDTDHFSLMEWSAGAARQNLLTRLSQVSPGDVFTTIITYEEQTRGWMAYAARARTTAQQVEAYRKLERHLDLYGRVQVLGFDERAGTEFERLRTARLRVGTMDLKIAAIALVHDATLLSRNLTDFHRVPGLKVEDWTLS